MNDPDKLRHVDTGGGAYIEGSVNVPGGNFAGRDLYVYLSRSEKEVLDDYLKGRIAIYEADILARRYTRPVPEKPYKSLLSFTLEDHTIFFGRTAAVEELFKRVKSNRLTVLHAPSGTGKSSLLQAGLMPRLLDKQMLPIYVSLTTDPANPVLALKKSHLLSSPDKWPTHLPQLALSEYLDRIMHLRNSNLRELIILFDQFEAFFVSGPTGEHRQHLIDSLANCVENQSLPVRFLIAIRKDYYSDLADFQSRMPHIFYNEVRLDALSPEQAREAITDPVKIVNSAVTYEQDLLDRLLNDFARQEVGLPQLQIVCDQLYKDRQQSVLSLAEYEKLGGIEGILGRYLTKSLKSLGGNRAVAEQILVALITTVGTKRVLTGQELSKQIGVKFQSLKKILARLVDDRLIQRSDDGGTITYEIAHESLVSEIQSWIDPAELEAKMAQEMLNREVATWRSYGTLIPRDRLDVLYPYRERFVGADQETLYCLLLSALVADHTFEEWVVIDNDLAEKAGLAALHNEMNVGPRGSLRLLAKLWVLPAVAALGSEDSKERQQGAKALGEAGDSRAIEPLIAVLDDTESDVRKAVIEALGRFGELAITRLITALSGENSYMRAAACVALGQLGDTRAVEPLIDALSDEDSYVRETASSALGELGDTRAVEPLIDALGDEDDNVREAASEALVQLGEAAVASLIAALSDKDSNVRAAASSALGELGDKRAVEPLIDALSDEDSNVRLAVSAALGELGDKRAVEPLTAILDDENEYVRGQVTWALTRLKTL